MSEDPQGNIGGNLTRSDPVQSREAKGHSFIQNGFEHFPFDPKKAVTVGFLVALLYFIGNVISTYKLAGSEVDTRIDNYKPLNQRLDKLDWRTDSCEKRIEKHDNEIDQLWKALNTRKK